MEVETAGAEVRAGQPHIAQRCAVGAAADGAFDRCKACCADRLAGVFDQMEVRLDLLQHIIIAVLDVQLHGTGAVALVEAVCNMLHLGLAGGKLGGIVVTHDVAQMRGGHIALHAGQVEEALAALGMLRAGEGGQCGVEFHSHILGVEHRVLGTAGVDAEAVDGHDRGSVIPLFIDQIKAGNPITITDPNMTRFLMNLDEAVDLVMFAFEHANPGDLFIQKSDASTIGDLAKAVQQLFGDTGTNIIGTRHGEKLFETLMTREERLRSEDMGGYYRVAADNRDLNYDKFVVKGEVHTMADDSYTSHNTNRLDVEGTVKKILTTEYVRNALKEMEAEKKA